MAEAKQYKVRLSKKFHSMTASGTRLTALRHSRGGVTLSSPDNVEYVGPLDKDQLEAIKNDPAFEVTSVKANESGNSGSGASQPAGTSGQAPADSAAPAPQTQTTTPPEGDGSVVTGPETDPNIVEKQTQAAKEAEAAGEGAGDGEGSTEATELPEDDGKGAGSDEGSEGSESDDPAVLSEADLKKLKNGNRDGAVAAATERGIEVTDQDTKAQIVDKIAAKQAESQE